MTHRPVQHFSGQIPARHVQRRLDVGVPKQRCVHQGVDLLGLGRILTEQMARQLTDARPCTGPKRGQIKRSQRANLAKPTQPLTGLDLDHRTVEHVDVLAVGPGVSTFLEREVDLVNPYARNFHGGSALAHFG